MAAITITMPTIPFAIALPNSMAAVRDGVA